MLPRSPIPGRDEASRSRYVGLQRPSWIEHERPTVSLDFPCVGCSWHGRRANSDAREIVLHEYSTMIDGKLPPRRREVSRRIDGRLEIETDQFGGIVAPGERVFRLPQRDHGAFSEPRSIALHRRCAGGITRGFGAIYFVPSVFFGPRARRLSEIARALETDCLREQCSDVAIGPNGVPPGWIELIEQNTYCGASCRRQTRVRTSVCWLRNRERISPRALDLHR